MSTQITRINETELSELIQMSRETFADTFGAENTPTDLQNYLDTAYAPAQLQRELQQTGSEFWFITVDQIPAGYLKLNVESAQSEKMGDDSLEIERIYIKKAYKRRGLGTKGYHFAVSEARRLGKAKIWLGVWEHNIPAQKFYQKMGFKQIGAHIFQLGQDKQKDLLLEKDLTEKFTDHTFKE